MNGSGALSVVVLSDEDAVAQESDAGSAIHPSLEEPHAANQAGLSLWGARRVEKERTRWARAGIPGERRPKPRSNDIASSIPAPVIGSALIIEMGMEVLVRDLIRDCPEPPVVDQSGSGTAFNKCDSGHIRSTVAELCV